MESLNGFYSGSLVETYPFLVCQFSSTRFCITIVFALEELELVFDILVLFSASK